MAAISAELVRARPLARALTARVGLTLVVAGSFLARLVAAASHPAPRYFPDEYLYTSIARALASGHLPAVRGQAVRFPALLEPILAAPLQAVFSPELAYRATQAENALFMSLAAVPVYLLARRLSLSAGFALGCAVFAVALPDLVYANYTLSDPVAYPFVFGALYLGVVALERPTVRAHVAFLAVAFLATFARTQYVVLPLAFLLAAIVVDGRQVLRRRRLVLALFAVPVLGALALGPSRALGVYGSVAHLHVGFQFGRWVVLDLFFLACASGIVLVPGALVALARPHGTLERAFAALAVAFTAGVVVQGALFGSNGIDRFQERYVFTVLPLVPLAFGLYLKHGRPGRHAVLGIACVLFLSAARVPLSGYVAGQGKADSPFLIAVARLEQGVGTGNGALVISLLVALGAAGAFAVSRGYGSRLAFGASVAAAVAASLAVAVSDAHNSQGIRNQAVAANPSWVDASGLGHVTLVQTLGSPTFPAIQQLYWNRSIVDERTLGPAQPTDSYATVAPLHIAKDGTLTGLGSHVLFEDFGATAQFSNGTTVARSHSFQLLSTRGAPRLSLLELGRYSDYWLARAGRLTVYPDRSGRTQGLLRFTLALPARASQALTVRFGDRTYRVSPGRPTPVQIHVDSRGAWTLPFSSARGYTLSDLRTVSVQSTPPVFRRTRLPSLTAQQS